MAGASISATVSHFVSTGAIALGGANVTHAVGPNHLDSIPLAIARAISIDASLEHPVGGNVPFSVGVLAVASISAMISQSVSGAVALGDANGIHAVGPNPQASLPHAISFAVFAGASCEAPAGSNVSISVSALAVAPAGSLCSRSVNASAIAFVGTTVALTVGYVSQGSITYVCVPFGSSVVLSIGAYWP